MSITAYSNIQTSVQEGDKYLHRPWGGTCQAHYENGCLWLLRSSSFFHSASSSLNDSGKLPEIQKYVQIGGDYRIWKCQSRRDTHQLLSGNIVWVLWDNRDMKRMRMDRETRDFYVEHGNFWVPFWSKTVSKIGTGFAGTNNAAAATSSSASADMEIDTCKSATTTTVPNLLLAYPMAEGDSYSMISDTLNGKRSNSFLGFSYGIGSSTATSAAHNKKLRYF